MKEKNGTNTTEAQIEAAAISFSIAFNEFANRVEGILLASASGTQYGSQHRMPALRGEATKAGKAVAKVAVARRPYRRTQKGKKLTWWHKLPQAEKDAIIAKRVKKSAETRKKAA